MSCACGKCKKNRKIVALNVITAKPVAERLESVARKVADMYGLKMGDFDFSCFVRHGHMQIAIIMREPK
jgi:hypothetical protein